MTEIPKLYTPDETREKLGGISKSVMAKLIKERAIDFIVLGHRRLAFTDDAIIKYLDSRTVRAQPYVPREETVK